MNTWKHQGFRVPFSNTGALINSSDVVVLGKGTARFIGVAVAAIAATTGTGELLIKGVATLPALSTDTGVTGDRFYWDTANTRMTVTRSSTTVYAGRLAANKLNGDTTADVDLNADDSSSGLLFSELVASTAITNTVAETAFDQSFTIPANTLKVGDVIRITAQAIATATNSTDTLNVKLKIGATVITQTGALDVANNDIALIRAELVVRTIGAGGTFVACGDNSIGTPGTATAKPFNLASTAIDTTAAQAITATATWSVANAGDSCRLDILDIEVISN